MMVHDPSPWLGRLTAVMIRGNTELRVRAHEEMSCVGVTATGAENLRTAIDNGLAD